MKEFDPIRPQSEKTELHAVKPVKTEKVLVEKFNPKPGQKIWQLDLNTRLITEAEFDVEKVIFVPKKDLLTGRNIGFVEKVVRDIIRKDGCLYEVATRPEIADKKFFKRLGIKYPKNKK